MGHKIGFEKAPAAPHLGRRQDPFAGVPAEGLRVELEEGGGLGEVERAKGRVGHQRTPVRVGRKAGRPGANAPRVPLGRIQGP